jgi:predicted nucleotidyltransferase
LCRFRPMAAPQRAQPRAKNRSSLALPSITFRVENLDRAIAGEIWQHFESKRVNFRDLTIVKNAFLVLNFGVEIFLQY